jgi:hypothetical protein
MHVCELFTEVLEQGKEFPASNAIWVTSICNVFRL